MAFLPWYLKRCVYLARRLSRNAIIDDALKYRLRSVRITPTLPHLNLFHDLARAGLVPTIKPQSLPPKLKPDKVLQVALFHIQVVLSSTKPKNVLTAQLLPNIKALETRLFGENVCVDHITAELIIKKLSAGVHGPVAKEILAIAISCALHQQQYDVADLPRWVESLNAPNVSASCLALTGLVNIPPCVISRILHRIPTSISESQLQLDLWLDNLTRLALSNMEELEKIFDKLVYYASRHCFTGLSQLVYQTCCFLENSNRGFTVPYFKDEYLNRCIWHMAVTSTLCAQWDPRQLLHVIDSQERIVSFMNTRSGGKEPPRNALDCSAYMGIVMLVQQCSPQKAEKLFQGAEKTILSGSDELSYRVTQLMMTSTPQDLVAKFNKYAQLNGASGILWHAFIKKLHLFGLLDQDRSCNILAQVMKHNHKLIISRDILALLIQSLHGSTCLDTFIAILGQRYTKEYAAIIISKQMRILYRNRGDITIPTTVYPWDKRMKKIGGTKFKGHASLVEYARFLGTKLSPSVRNWGHILQGEAMVDVDAAFDLYVREFLHKKLPPNSQCLSSLIKMAILKPTLEHDGFVVPQIAVYQFKNNVRRNTRDDHTLLMPTNELWQQYIHLLFKYEYVPELADLIGWWEQIQHIPDKKTLLTLCAALPREYASRYIKHFAKSSFSELQSTSWTWPDEAELDKFIESDSRFHRVFAATRITTYSTRKTGFLSFFQPRR